LDIANELEHLTKSQVTIIL